MFVMVGRLLINYRITKEGNTKKNNLFELYIVLSNCSHPKHDTLYIVCSLVAHTTPPPYNSPYSHRTAPAIVDRNQTYPTHRRDFPSNKCQAPRPSPYIRRHHFHFNYISLHCRAQINKVKRDGKLNSAHVRLNKYVGSRTHVHI